MLKDHSQDMCCSLGLEVAELALRCSQHLVCSFGSIPHQIPEVCCDPLLGEAHTPRAELVSLWQVTVHALQTHLPAIDQDLYNYANMPAHRC